MNKKEKTYTVVVHEVGKEDQIREHVDQLIASLMAFPEKFANGKIWVELILENN